MSIDEADKTAASTDGGSAPLLRTLGDADAAVCADGFCAVPSAGPSVSQAGPGAEQ